MTPKKEADRLTPKKRSSQATLLSDQRVVLSSFVQSVQTLSNPSSLTTLLNPCQIPGVDIIEISSPQAWASALQEIDAAGICGLDLETTGLDPLSCRARLCQFSLPSGRVYVADLWELGREGASPLQDLGWLSNVPT